ncbi:polyprenol phosphomannose-dependent alpha 1,6 mannosyltransferase MptB [Couchioplanes azureus]|uniref:polyprenol phosphomannose-dependent alpha 1,6 mannosyltransferase MptB n=1 Tax=Couchioplanes caeruleus TaxID=56438 RepID=UPI0019CF4282|nr:polyprenol phosphomannose-dependent alpha 1,6 mannosyltransferase MptB [Couchioplanes caeruleus]GGQ87206.1 membrane protein [Couchioplanes caeruleus subsp. azureus]
MRALVRWGGLAGSLLIAVAAHLGGSPFARGTTVTPGSILTGSQGVVMPLCWVAGLAAVSCAWWFGRHHVPSTRWAVVTAGLWSLPLLPVLPLGSEDIYSYACQGFVQHAGGDPYAGGVQSFGCPWLESVSTTWRASPAPYGPLFLLLAGWAVALGSSLTGVIAGLRIIALIGLAVLAAGLARLARHCGRDPGRVVWTVLACPLVPIHLVSGAHNDALMVGLLVLGLALVAAGRDAAAPGAVVATPALVLAGVPLGLAVAVKATAVVVLPFAVLAAVPAGSPLRSLWRPATVVGAGAAGAVALVSVVSGRGVGWVAGLLRSGDTVAWTSPSTAVGLAVESVARLAGARVAAVPVTRILGVVVLAVLLAVLWWRARAGGALAGAGLALAATVLCAPVFHPWYATWPLAVLAATRRESRRLLGCCAFAGTLTLPAGYNWALFTKVPGALVVTAALGALLVVAVRERRARRVSA